ncbi:MAG: sulfite exporter TauE/SafE family protein [Anaerolineae bacterium]|nr:sulfite exporter TauE/SafE family protein [Anaerolineae bacterium]
MTDNPLIFLSMTALVICLIGFSKGGFDSTMGALGTPLMALVMPADQAVGLLLPILMIADVFAVASHWKRWDRKLVTLLIPGAIVGVIIGTLFIANVSPTILRRGIGVIALLFAVYKFFEQYIFGSITYQARNWHGLAAGTAAGFSSALAHTGGPPITIYLLMQKVTPRVFVATSALFFMVLNWLKVPTYYYANLFDFELLGQVVWLLPLLPVSVWVGKVISTKINKFIFDRIILVFLVASGVLLLVR